jgi:hypothetical protein
MTTPSTPAGWYPDPDDSRGTRYWDGTAWTEPVAEPTAEEPAGPPSLEPMPFEPPTFESFETPSFESISSGSFEVPAPPPPAAEATPPPAAEATPPPAAEATPPPAAEATSALEVPGTFEEPSPEPPTTAVPTSTESSQFPTWASDAPSASAAPAAFTGPASFANPPSAASPHSGPPDNRRLIIGFLSAVGVLWLILVLILVYALVIRDRGPNDITSSTLPSFSAEATPGQASEQPVAETETEAAAVPAEGEIVDGPFTISVASTERGDTISSTINEYLEKTAVGEFFVVYLNVGNTSGDVQEFLSTLQVLNTDAGTIAPDDEASFYLGGGVVAVSPGEVLETAVVFDVPIGTLASGIVVHGVPGMAGGELPLE